MSEIKHLIFASSPLPHLFWFDCNMVTYLITAVCGDAVRDIYHKHLIRIRLVGAADSNLVLVVVDKVIG